MTIKDLEERTGLSRANIRFYEKEGLLSPLRRENGYREYTEADVQTLLRVKLLRGLRLPLDEIRAVKNETKTMEAVMGTHLHRLEKEKIDIERAKQVCRHIQEAKTKFKEIDAQEYLDKLKNNELFVRNEKQAQRDTAPAIPIRRYIARTIDMNFYSFIWLSILLLKKGQYPFRLSLDIYDWTGIQPTAVGGWLDYYVMICPLLGIITMVLLEPLWIRWFRATPGKFIMSLRFSDPMPLREGVRRTYRMIRYGFGYFIPIYIWYRWWKSYWDISYGNARWDEGSSVVEAEESNEWWLAGKFILTYGALLAGIYLSHWSIYVPPHQGPLTVSEFEENYCFYDHYFLGSGEPWFLNKMRGSDQYPYPYSVEYETDEEGIIRAIYMDCEGTETWNDYDPENIYVWPVDQDVFATILLVMERDYMEAAVPESYYEDMRIRINQEDIMEQRSFSYEQNGIRVEYQYDPLKGSRFYLQVMK